MDNQAIKTVVEKTGLSEVTCAALFDAGWMYVEPIDEPARWTKFNPYAKQPST